MSFICSSTRKKSAKKVIHSFFALFLHFSCSEPFIPEPLHSFFNLSQGYLFILRPLPWEHFQIGSSTEPLVQQHHNPQILRRPDDPSCRLKHLVHPRVAVSIIKAAVPSFFKITLQDLTFIADHGNSCPHNDGSD